MCKTKHQQVYVSQLATSDENLVIAAEGLLAVSPPKEIATLLQHFNAGNLSETKRAFCGIKEQQLEILRQQQDAGEGQQAGGIGGGGGAAGRGGKATNRKTTDTSAVEEQQSQLVEVRVGHEGLADVCVLKHAVGKSWIVPGAAKQTVLHSHLAAP